MPDGIEIIIDCRWSSRGFFAFPRQRESQTDTIVGRYHILRKKERDSEQHTYEESLKVKESYGVDKVMQNLQKEGILVKSFTHDANASTLNIIQKYFPNSIEHLNINHSAKNLKRRMLYN